MAVTNSSHRNKSSNIIMDVGARLCILPGALYEFIAALALAITV